MAHEPTRYASPTSQRGAVGLHALRSSLSADVRQPDLGQPPAVSAITGFGTVMAGASITSNGSAADRSQGLVAIRVGIAPGASGNVTLSFPAGVATGQYVYFADWAALAPQIPAAGNQTINWTASRSLIPNENINLAYQWTVST